MPAKQRKQLLNDRLQALNPTELEIVDQSHLHIGHEGSKDGSSHFHVTIASDQFKGLNTLARHRLVYQQVHDLIPFPIHALAIDAKNNP